MDLVTAQLALGPVQPVELLGHRGALRRAEHALDDGEALLVELGQLRRIQGTGLHAQLA